MYTAFPKTARLVPGAHIFDAAERVIVAGLYAFLFTRVLVSFLETRNPIGLLLLLSEGLVVLFVLLRRRTEDISLRPRDWLLALAGTIAPLLVDPSGGAALAPVSSWGMFMLGGLSLQIAAKLTLGRRFGIVPANRGVTVRGPYRFLRHPMYAGYLLTHIGFFLGCASLWNGAIYLAEIAFQIARIKAEERLLAGDPDYAAFKSKVRYRLIPGVF